ncbi:adenylate/guanylate cyclase domain-containing protein, partial [Escherichia coli]|nr:adenylate/guanylate cyclase domain-containing protein [Escherichia coli]
AAVSGRINSFLDAVTDTIVKSDGFILAFYGDCVVAVWPPGFSGPDHAAKAQTAARRLVQQGAAITGADGKAIPFGVGVHTGPIFIGTVQAARGLFRDISIFGHGVNLTARLAGAAQAGEALLSEAAVQAAGQGQDLPRRALELKGITGETTAYALG